MEISAGVYRQMTPNPDFSEELNLLAEITAEHPQLYQVGELFASDPGMTEIIFKLLNGEMEITAVKVPTYQGEEIVRVSTSLPEEVGYEIIQRLIPVYHFVDENANEITAS
jgi:hypothetical protein